MSQNQKVSGVATTTRQENGSTVIRYHNTDVVRFDNDKIILNSGGWYTPTTKLRMNQASNQYGLGFDVFQRNLTWYVRFDGKIKEFESGMTLDRLNGSVHYQGNRYGVAGDIR